LEKTGEDFDNSKDNIASPNEENDPISAVLALVKENNCAVVIWTLNRLQTTIFS